jgi:hypothetical protein
VKLTTVLIGLAAMAISLPAGTINFAGGGSLGSTNTYGPVTATGYLSNSTTGTLFGKGTAGGTGSEDGLGLTADPTGNNEIFAKLATGAAASDFIQLDISALSGTIKISMGSTGGDTWAVFGSNSAGILGGTMLASGGGDDGAEVTVTNATSYKYLDVRAATNNVLLQDLVYTGSESSVPEPGTLGIVGLGGVLIGLLRRKVNQKQA